MHFYCALHVQMSNFVVVVTQATIKKVYSGACTEINLADYSSNLLLWKLHTEMLTHTFVLVYNEVDS